MKNYYKLLVSTFLMSALFACTMVDNSDPELIEKIEKQEQAVRDSIERVEQAKDDATCDEFFLDKRDSTKYELIRVYDAEKNAKADCWFKENLAYDDDNSVCYEDEKNESKKCKKYGRLYQGSKLNGVCPEGTHVATQSEWNYLAEVFSVEKRGASILKQDGDDDWSLGDAEKASNSTDFSALAAGFYETDEGYFSVGETGFWWVDAGSDKKPASRSIDLDDNKLGVQNVVEEAAYRYYSVRCVVGDGNTSISWEDGKPSGSDSGSSSSNNSGSGSDNGSGSGSNNDSGNDTPSEITSVNVDLSGYTQKGPFVKGSEITAYELQDGYTLKQTGRTYGGIISADDGKFEIPRVSLSSQYAYLQVDGYYKNETTGENSTSRIQLRAITDLTKRKSVNVNLLTHLEYERVAYLVTEKGLRVSAAKSKAEEGVFKSFLVDLDDSTLSEDLNVTGTSNADAALLAISVMVLGGNSESQVTDLLAAISKAVKDSGEWKDDSQRTRMADWLSSADYGAIRKNIASWKIADSIGNFEKYLTNFWTTIYDIGLCDDSNKGKIVWTDNSFSANKKSSKTRYLCENKNWRLATDYEKDTEGWKSGEDGDVRNGRVNNDFVYVFDGNAWRLGNELDSTLGINGCTKNREGVVAKAENSKWYICRDSLWTPATDLEKDTYKWTAGEDGDVRNGRVNNDLVYVYDGDAWRLGNELDSTLGIGGCTVAKARTLKKTSKSVWYICTNDTLTWRKASDVEVTLNGHECKVDGDTVVSKTNESLIYVCDKKVTGWRLMNSSEVAEGKGCTDLMLGETVDFDGAKKVCDATHEWISAGFYSLHTDKNEFFNENISYGSMTDKRDGHVYKTVKLNNLIWMAENLNFYSEDSTNLVGQSWCYDNNPKNCDVGGRLYSWIGALNADKSYLGDMFDYSENNVQGVCPEGWHIPMSTDAQKLLLLEDDIPEEDDLSLYLRSKKGWSAVQGSDYFGFSAVPFGYYNSADNSFVDAGERWIMWLAQIDKTPNAAVLYMRNDPDHAEVFMDSFDRLTGASVRCVCDETDFAKCK